MTPTPTDAAWPPALVYSAVIVAAILIALAFWIWQKGRRLPGEHVFRASRFGRGNHLFPAQVLVTSSSITLYTPQWIGKLEESIHLAHVASIRIDTHLMFADVYIETSGGQNPVVCHGHTKGDAVRMKDVIERFQSEYLPQEGVTRRGVRASRPQRLSGFDRSASLRRQFPIPNYWTVSAVRSSARRRSCRRSTLPVPSDGMASIAIRCSRRGSHSRGSSLCESRSQS